MAERSYPFDGGSGAILTEDDWSDMAKNWQDDGVIAPQLNSTDLVATAAGANTVNLSTGAAIIQGFMYRNTAVLPVTFATNSDVNPRVDRLVLRLDRNTNTIQAIAKQGTPAASPVAPALDTTYPIYEIALASFRVNAGTSAATLITAERTFSSRFIRVSAGSTGHPQGSIFYNSLTDTFHTVKAAGVVTEIGGATPPPVASYYLKTKDADGASLSGTGTIVDPDLTYTFPSAGKYHVSGHVFLLPTTANATIQVSLTSVPTPTYIKGVFEKHDGRVIVNATTTTILLTATAIGAYEVYFDFIFNVTGSQPVSVRSGQHINGNWQITQGSFIRVEAVTV